jgi:4-hydroxymandelate oxidase
MSRMDLTRRRTLVGFGALLPAAPLAQAQKLAGEVPGRIPPADELLNAAEFEAIAERKLDSFTFAEIKGSERAAFDRITFRPRLMVDTRKMDLTSQLFGQTLFMPILVGPVGNQKRYHPEGELEMARGASAAKAPMVVAAQSSFPLDRIAAEAKTPLWFQVSLDGEPNDLRDRVERAVGAGCKVICVTIGDRTPAAGAAAPRTGVDWGALDRLRRGLTVPVVLKGVMSPEGARAAVSHGTQGIVVSNYEAPAIAGIASPIEVLPSVVDAVGGKVPVLMDGSVRLGSDVMKALAFGAQAILLARPAVWGLAAYGAQGVQNVIELIQSEFARDMAMCGKIDLKALDRTVVKIHRG